MRTTSVRSTSLALTALFLVAALLFAWDTADTSGRREAPVVSGAQAFERGCARCHDPDELAGQLDTARAALEMLGFLDEHGAEEAREDRAIVEFLVERRR